MLVVVLASSRAPPVRAVRLFALLSGASGGGLCESFETSVKGRNVWFAFRATEGSVWTFRVEGRSRGQHQDVSLSQQHKGEDPPPTTKQLYSSTQSQFQTRQDVPYSCLVRMVDLFVFPQTRPRKQRSSSQFLSS